MKSVETVILDANIRTVSRSGAPQAEALAIFEGRVVAVGTNSEIEPLIGNGTRVLRLRGMTVLPGFVESHNHPSLFGATRTWVDCRSPLNPSIHDIVRRVAQRAAEMPHGTWIQGWGYDDTLVSERRAPTRYDLDRVSPHHPVFLWHSSGHLNVANSLALKLAGITADTPNEFEGLHGVIVKDPQTGEPTGELQERGARNRVSRLIPKPTENELAESIAASLREYARSGITSIHDAGVGIVGGWNEVAAYRKLAERRRMAARVTMMVRDELVPEDSQQAKQELGKSPDLDWLRLGCVKITQDGSIQGLTAALTRDYACVHHHGVELRDVEALTQRVQNLHRAGFQIAVHANGDEAIESVIKAVGAALEDLPRNDHRHRIEHCQTVRDDQLERMASLGISASFFVKHVYYWGDRHRDLFLGPDRAQHISPLNSAIKYGVRWALHSDCPITPPEPLFGVWCATRRLTLSGDVLGADERVPLDKALDGYGRSAAWLCFDESRVGSLESGKFADFVVLNEDPYAVALDDVREVQPLLTVAGGAATFVHDGASEEFKDFAGSRPR